MRKIEFRILVALVFAANVLFAQYKPAAENLKNREWFQDAKFGLFIHWGVYSVLGDGEWVMNNQQIPIKAYEKILRFSIRRNSIRRHGYKWRKMQA